ncbi:hypothetical protein B0T11DRAFT_120473 [Plectosphaerella cucumerina]|uniref:SigF-like NTF2-like domain-containing protein n=1 Tax=Plectosphaerella cucumerina TaxID=40658 RepID=A0A8K0TB77_9PEZI|nr:hypothetical protein B0T11DRAFT_120473 [Plectosphaerella cucumerina]
MDHPVKEIRTVIKSLVQGSPAEQERAVNAYFLPEASFTHPFCHVPAVAPVTVPLTGGHTLSSRWFILMIYRWYRILSPRIDIEIDSVVHDQKANILYVTMTQIFTFFFLPFYHADPHFTIVLHLEQRPLGPDGGPLPNPEAGAVADAPAGTATVNGDAPRMRYFIASQNDHYQVTEWLKFVAPWFGPLLHRGWQLFATLLSVAGALLLAPLSWLDLQAGETSKKGMLA